MKWFLEFEKCCRRLFQFLVVEFGCDLIANERDNFGVYITYKNATTAIRISFEPREGGIFVLLSRLVGGNVPTYPIFIGPETVINSFYLDDIISLRDPSKGMQQTLPKEITKTYLEKCLATYADALRQYGADILRGDFGLFRELEKVVKRRQIE